MAETRETQEGRLLAHRKLLIRLLRQAANGPEGDELLEWMRDRTTLSDQQEDPGAVPQEELAIESALADEFARILKAVEGESGRS